MQFLEGDLKQKDKGILVQLKLFVFNERSF